MNPCPNCGSERTYTERWAFEGEYADVFICPDCGLSKHADSMEP